MQRFASSIDLVLPHLASSLLDATARSRLIALTRTFPFLTQACLEFRLSSTEPQVDLAGELRCSRLHLPDPWLNTPEWKAVHALCLHRQHHEAALLFDHIEFDLTTEPGPIPRPRLFVAPLSSPQSVFTVEEVLNALALIQAPVPGGPDVFRSHLETCLEALPQGGGLYFIGTTQLNPPVIRLVIDLSTSEATTVTAYLRTVGCEEAALHLAPVLDQLGPPFSYVNLDLSEQIQPRAGVELQMVDPKLPPNRTEAALDRLVELGLATQAKRDALLAWSGYHRIDPDKTEVVLNGLLGVNTPDVLIRNLSHIKVTYSPRGRLKAKAYARFAHFSAETLKQKLL